MTTVMATDTYVEPGDIRLERNDLIFKGLQPSVTTYEMQKSNFKKKLRASSTTS